VRAGRCTFERTFSDAPDPANFRRKVLATVGYVRPADRVGAPSTAGVLPPELYRRGVAGLIGPPLARPAGGPATPRE